MRLLARGRQLGQDAAPVVRIGAPADQAVLLEAIDQLGDVGAHAVLARSEIGQGQGFPGIRQKVEHRELRQGQSCRAQGRLEARLDHVRRAQEREDEGVGRRAARAFAGTLARSEEHTSELQSPYDLVCRLLLEKKKKKKNIYVQ